MKIAVFLFLSVFLIGAVQNISVRVTIKLKSDITAYIGVFRYVLLKADVVDIMQKSKVPPQKAVSFIGQSNVFSSVIIKNLRINAVVGIKNDAFATAVITAVLSNAANTAVNVIPLIEKKNAEINIVPEYGENVFFFDADGIISLSVPVLASCLLRYATKNKREERRVIRDN